MHASSRFSRLMALVFVGASIFGGGAGLASAAPASTLTPRQMLHHSLLASLAMKSVHMIGTVSYIASLNLHGATLSIAGSAHFRGDFSDRSRAAFHLRGQERIGPQAKYFKLAEVGRKLADRLGKQKWQCSKVPTTSMPTNLAELLKLHNLFRKIERKARIVNLGPGSYRGTPVWDIQATVLARIPTSIFGAGQPNPASPKYFRIALRSNFWINQRNYTLRRLALIGALKSGGTKLKMTLTDRLSHYSEHVPIVLPPACGSGKKY